MKLLVLLFFKSWNISCYFVSYSFTTVYKGDQVTETVNGQRFNAKINAIINNTKSGNSITVSNIMAKRTDAKGTATRSLPPLVLKIK